AHRAGRPEAVRRRDAVVFAIAQKRRRDQHAKEDPIAGEQDHVDDDRDERGGSQEPLHDGRSASMRSGSPGSAAPSTGSATRPPLRPPQRRSRFWYSSTARSRSVREKSG